MNLETLCSYLSDYEPRLISNDAGKDLRSVRLIAGSDCHSYCSGILYVGMLSSFYHFKDIPDCISFLCIEDVPLSYKMTDISIALVSNKYPINMLLNEVQQVMTSSSVGTAYWNDLLDVALKQGRAQDIVDIANKLFENPVILSDRSTKLIARSGSFVENSKLWKDHSDYGYFSYETMQMQNYKRVSQRLDENAQPVLLQKETSEYDTINGKIYIGSTKIASLSVLNVNRPFREEDINLLNRLCKVFSYYFKMDSFYKFVCDAKRESFFKDLIENRFPDTLKMESRAKSLNLKTDIDYCVMLAAGKDWHFEKNPLNFRLELEKYLPKCYTLISENGIVAIMDKQHLYDPEFNLQGLIEFLRANKVQAGISRNICGLSRLHEQYLQAVNARQTGINLSGSKSIFDYDDYALYCLFSNVPSHIKLNDFCNPALLKLIAYDRKNNTEYVKTLYTFLIHNQNYTDAAKALFIHRTSIFYRIKKTEEIMEMQLNNSELLNNIYFSYLILFVLKELDLNF